MSNGWPAFCSLKFMFALLEKNSFDLLLKKIKNTGTENPKSNLVLLLQSSGTKLLLKEITEYQYRITFGVPVPNFR